MRRHVGRAVAAVTIVGAVVSGCGGPGGPGTGAVVGEHVISLNDIEQQVDAAYADRNQLVANQAFQWGASGLSRMVVDAAVGDAIVGAQAAASGVTVAPADVDRTSQEVARGMYEEQVNAGNQAVQDDNVIRGLLAVTGRSAHWQTAAIALGRAAVGRVSVVVDEVAVRDRATAERSARILATGGPAADALLAGPGARRGVEYKIATDPERAGTVVFGVPQGAVVAYQPSPANASWSVARVVSRRTDGAFDSAGADKVSLSELLDIGKRVAQAEQVHNPVVVNPRFGVWDPVNFMVVQPADVAGLVLLPN